MNYSKEAILKIIEGIKQLDADKKLQPIDVYEGSVSRIKYYIGYLSMECANIYKSKIPRLSISIYSMIKSHINSKYQRVNPVKVDIYATIVKYNDNREDTYILNIKEHKADHMISRDKYEYRNIGTYPALTFDVSRLRLDKYLTHDIHLLIGDSNNFQTYKETDLPKLVAQLYSLHTQAYYQESLGEIVYHIQKAIETSDFSPAVKKLCTKYHRTKFSIELDKARKNIIIYATFSDVTKIENTVNITINLSNKLRYMRDLDGAIGIYNMFSEVRNRLNK